MTRRNWLVFAAMLIAASALALTGCGGDDGGLSAEDMARIDTAEASAAAAMAAQADAEADAAAAMAAQTAAEADAMAARAAEAAAVAAQMMAEDNAAAAMMAQMEAEEDAAAAMAAQMEAERDEATAVAAQMAAEASAAEATAGRLVAEAAAAAAMAELSDTQEDLDAANMALDAANTALAAATEARDMALAAQAAAEMDAMEAMEAAAAAETARMAAETARAAAVMAQTAAETAQGVAEGLRAAAVEAQGVAEAARNAAVAAQAAAEAAQKDAEDALAEANEEIEALKEAAMVPTDAEIARQTAAGRAAAARIQNAVGPRGLPARVGDYDAMGDPLATPTPNDMTDDVLFPADPDTVEGIRGGASIAGLSQSRLGQDAMLSIAVSGGSGLNTDDDTAATDAPRIDGFTGVALEKDGPGPITQMALVYSDAERSVRAFGDVYRYNWGVDAATGAPLTAAPTSEASRTHLLIGDQAAMNAALMDGGKANLVHGLSTSTGVLMRNITQTANTVRGSYDGVPGLYVFEGTPSINLDSDGSTVTVMGTSMQVLFRADNHEQLLPDSDYLAFGVWTEVPDNPSHANPGRTRPFVSGNAGAYDLMDVQGLNGSASYSGGAVGHWATRAAGQRAVDMGRFTADASLTADFDSTAVVLSGMINGFVDEETDDPIPGWLVNLSAGMMLVGTPGDGSDLTAAQAALAARPSTDSDIYGSTSGTTGSLSWTGVFDAWLFGANKANYPTGVAGRFQADAGVPNPPTINEYTDVGFAGVVGSFAGR